MQFDQPTAGKLPRRRCLRLARAPRYLYANVIAQRASPPERLHRTLPPSSAPKPPSGPGWVHEIKLDGFRLMALKARVPDFARSWRRE
jgi:hypothetical protein